MKAVVIHEYGDPSRLRYEDVPEPKPGAGEVLVKVISTSVNPVDYKLRSGALRQMMPLVLPVILGRDVAGEVADAGEGVTSLKTGDLVMGLVNQSYAEYLTAKADVLARIPQGMNPEDAGVLPLILLTGAQLIESGVQPKAGETILVTGAAGSVGRTAVYVAKEHGAKVIAGVLRRQLSIAGELGADRVVALDDDDAVQSLPELDAIADTVGGATVAKLIPKLKKSGRLASVVGKPEGAESLDVRPVWAQPDAARLHRLAHDVRDGRLTIPIALRLPLSRIVEAHEAAEKHTQGKILLYP